MKGFWANRKARVGCILVGFLSLLTGAAHLFMESDAASSQHHPSLVPPSLDHWFGTTIQGQDVFSQFILGAAPTIYFAVLIGIGVTLSVLVGVTAGFLGGWVDHLLSLVINIFSSSPGCHQIVPASCRPAWEHCAGAYRNRMFLGRASYEAKHSP